MSIDYSKRCLKPNGNFDRLYYGHTAAEYDGPGRETVRDVTDTFDDRPSWRRRPTTELTPTRYFFSERIE